MQIQMELHDVLNVGTNIAVVSDQIQGVMSRGAAGLTVPAM